MVAWRSTVAKCLWPEGVGVPSVADVAMGGPLRLRTRGARRLLQPLRPESRTQLGEGADSLAELHTQVLRWPDAPLPDEGGGGPRIKCRQAYVEPAGR